MLDGQNTLKKAKFSAMHMLYVGGIFATKMAFACMVQISFENYCRIPKIKLSLRNYFRISRDFFAILWVYFMTHLNKKSPFDYRNGFCWPKSH